MTPEAEIAHMRHAHPGCGRILDSALASQGARHQQEMEEARRETEKRMTQRYAAIKYANVLPLIREVAREQGYAIGVHGSQLRDLDVIAVPWVEWAKTGEVLARTICAALEGVIVNDEKADPNDWTRRNPQPKPLGRVGWSIQLGAGLYVDLSVMSPVKAEQELAEAKRERDEARASRDSHLAALTKTRGFQDKAERALSEAESKLREATEREKMLREALNNLYDSIPHHEGDDNLTEVLRSALATLRSDPAPQEQPPEPQRSCHRIAEGDHWACAAHGRRFRQAALTCGPAHPPTAKCNGQHEQDQCPPPPPEQETPKPEPPEMLAKRAKAPPRHFAIRSRPIALAGVGLGGLADNVVQCKVYPSGSDQGYFHTGHHDAVMELPGPNGLRYMLTRRQIHDIFEAAEEQRLNPPDPPQRDHGGHGE